ncbi:MAG: hypothetical protein JXJ04_20215, partial [Spirochaetales bacterium]|nr:hypothetical protein [Spirochaetales bacterium]
TIIIFFKYDIKFMKQTALVFFCAFIFVKYYDLVWLLLHKSLVLMILGLLCAGLATIAGLRWGVYKKHAQ